MDINEFLKRIKSEEENPLPDILEEIKREEPIKIKKEPLLLDDEKPETEEIDFIVKENKILNKQEHEVEFRKHAVYPAVNPTKILLPDYYKKNGWISIGIEVATLNDPEDRFSPRTKVKAEAMLHIPQTNTSPEEIKQALLNLGSTVEEAALKQLEHTLSKQQERSDIIMIAKINIWDKVSEVIDTLTTDNPHHVFMVIKKQLYVFFRDNLTLKIRKNLMEQYQWKNDVKKYISFNVSSETSVKTVKETDTFYTIEFELGSVREVVDAAIMEMVNTTEIDKELEIEFKEKKKKKRRNANKEMTAKVVQEKPKEKKPKKKKEEKVKMDNFLDMAKLNEIKKEIQSKKKRTTKKSIKANVAKTEGSWMTVKEAAEKLGISTRTVYRRIKSGEFLMKEEGKTKYVLIRGK